MSQLNKKYRPINFDQVFGQSLNKEILKAIIKKPLTSPRSFIFSGEYGTGKTTLARIFAKGLNCTSNKLIKPCNDCDNCKSNLDFSSFYQEFDSGSIGNKEDIEELKDDFFSSSLVCKYRVIVFDEGHLISRQAQSSLLKILEDISSNIFVIFCTTELGQLRDTIQSRSQILDFRCLSSTDIVNNLKYIVKSEQGSIEDDVLNLIASTSRGHVRDAVKLLELYFMLDDKEKFKLNIKSSEIILLNFLKAVRSNVDLNEYIEQLCSFVIDVLRNDFYLVIRNLVFYFCSGDFQSSYKDLYKEVMDLYDQDVLKIHAFSLSDWVVNSFKNDITVQALLWSFFYRFKNKSQQILDNSLLQRAIKK
jgi:DNA polymerase III gamma/tau subunit